MHLTTSPSNEFDHIYPRGIVLGASEERSRTWACKRNALRPSRSGGECGLGACVRSTPTDYRAHVTEGVRSCSAALSGGAHRLFRPAACPNRRPVMLWYKTDRERCAG